MNTSDEPHPEYENPFSARYEIRKILGQGGAGEVYLAWDVQLRRTVAIKKMRQGRLYRDEGAADEIVKDAWTEAMCLAAIRHPNIVAVYDLGMEGQLPYLVMEYVQGETLDKRVIRSALDEEEFVDLAKQILSGVVAAHQTGLVHRDLKPENIILTRLPSGHSQAKILDFGIAKYLHQPEVQTVDLDGAIKGSVHWIAPEQLNSEPIDQRCDLYSLGCVFYFALTAKPPFGRGNVSTVITAHLMHQVTSLEALRPDLPKPLTQWVMSLMQRAPADRPQSALAALETLEALYGNRRTIPSKFAAEPASQTDSSPSFESSPTVRFEIPTPTESRAGWNPYPFIRQIYRKNLPLLGTGIAALLLTISALFFSARKPTPTPAPKADSHQTCTLRIHGSNTIGTKMAPMLVQAFLKSRNAAEIKVVTGDNPLEQRIEYRTPKESLAAFIEIHSHGSKTAFSDLAEGACDIGMSSAPISNTDAERLLKSGLGDMRMRSAEQVVALDGLAVTVHPSNPLAQLSREQLAAIFSGRVTDWSELCTGLQGKIHLYSRDNDSGTFDIFKSLVLREKPLSSDSKRFEDSTELSEAVATDPLAIGFAGLPYVLNCKALAVSDGDSPALLPTPFTIATEDYVLSRRLYFYSPQSTQNSLAKDFIEFALSEIGQSIVSDAGFIKQSVETQRILIPPKAPREYQTLAQNAKRLSLSLRFRPDSAALDAKAERDLDRMLKVLENPNFKAQSLSLVGFCEKGDDEKGDLQKSHALAETVAQALQIRGVQPALMTGFGSELALASNEYDLGRSKNRRVEVWLQSAPNF